MSNQPIIFNIQYTPYTLPKNATAEECRQHASDRAFYDMTGGKNIFDYMTTQDKQTGGYTIFEYLKKNTGVFNDKGMIPKEEIAQMKARLKENKGHIHHGFISLNAQESHKIDTPEKCIEMIKHIFPTFLKDAGFRPDNIDLMCALHLDKPHHLHVHFVFWEKEPKIKDTKNGGTTYKRVGKIKKSAIDNMFVRLGLYFSDEKEILYKTRDQAILDLRGMFAVKAYLNKPQDVQDAIIALARDLPYNCSFHYNSKDMILYSERIDKIVSMMLGCSEQARRADTRFKQALQIKRRQIENICGMPFAFSNKNVQPDEMELPKYHNKIDTGNIHIIEDIEDDYRRRQGNLVLKFIKSVKPHLYKNTKRRKVNDKTLKRALRMSANSISRSFKKFLSSFGAESRFIERDFTNRLQEIEEEMERDREAQQNKTHNNQTK